MISCYLFLALLPEQASLFLVLVAADLAIGLCYAWGRETPGGWAEFTLLVLLWPLFLLGIARMTDGGGE